MTFKPSSSHATKTEVSVSITTHTFLRLASLTMLTLVFVLAVHKAAHALMIIFIAFFLALALNGPVFWVSKHLPGKRRGSRSLATSLSFLIVVILLGAFLASLVPPLVKQTNSFIHAAPNIIKDFRSQDSTTGELIRKYNLEDQVDDVSKQLQQRLKHAGGSAVSGAQQFGSSVFTLLTVLALTFMMLVEGPRWIKLAHEIIPDDKHAVADRMANDMYRVIKGYINGQVTLAALAAVLIFPAMWILDVSYPVALMVVVFICGLIPMVGHTIGAAIVTVVALFTSPSHAAIILVYYITYQQIENYFIQPRIQSNSTNMSPLLVFASVVVGVSFGGLVGGLLAIPVAGCIRIALLEYLRSHDFITTPSFDGLTNEAGKAKA